MAIGFAKTSNLFESQDGQSATGIMNNLAGAGIADDVALFANNLSFVTELDYGEANYTASAQDFYSADEVYYSSGTPANDLTFIIIPPAASGFVPYTNKTVIYTLASDGVTKEYHIVDDSNDRDRFQLYEYDADTKSKKSFALNVAPALQKCKIKTVGSVSQADWNTLAGTSDIEYGPGSQIFLQSAGSTATNAETAQVEYIRSWASFYNLATKIFFRTDPVTFLNMTNLSKDRLTLNDGSTSLENPYSPPEGSSANRDRSQQATFLKQISADEYLPGIQLAIDSFIFKETKNLANYRKNVLDDLLTVDGSVQITNDTLIQNTAANTAVMPGLYIYSQGQSLRAFSGLYNPWEEGTETINGASKNVLRTEAASQDAEVFKLIFEGPGPTISATGTNAVREAATGTDLNVNATFTHKAEIIVNGETYYLLLSNTEPNFT